MMMSPGGTLCKAGVPLCGAKVSRTLSVQSSFAMGGAFKQLPLSNLEAQPSSLSNLEAQPSSTSTLEAQPELLPSMGWKALPQDHPSV